MPSSSTDADIVWSPTPERVARAGVTAFTRWLADSGRGEIASYDELYAWSVEDLPGFWAAIWNYFDVQSTDYTDVLRDCEMPGQQWFVGAQLNFAEHMLRAGGDLTAVVAIDENDRRVALTYAELTAAVGAARAGLVRHGVEAGTRVVAVLPNRVETIVAMLATASLGAVWSVCPPDFGAHSIVERFAQIEPSLLIVADGYSYGGKVVDLGAMIAELTDSLPTVTAVVVVRTAHGSWRPGDGRDGVTQSSWEQLVSQEAEPTFAAVAFDHPLWVLYSSGTTGRPKAIVQSHGGILLEQLKSQAFHTDVHQGDRFMWFTSTGWMVWNYLVCGLLMGACVILYDGSPTYPRREHLWEIAEREGVAIFGTSPPFLRATRLAEISPRTAFDLRIRTVCSTGSPLMPEELRWASQHLGDDVLVSSASGGTDVCAAVVGTVPTLPVRAGEIQTRLLGCAVESFDDDGRPVRGELGELVIVRPMPSMPVSFWGDPDGSKQHEAYFDRYPGVWRHGDWIEITSRGSCILTGRSDATLNRGGVRMGTAEFYRSVEQAPQVVDSLVVDTGVLWLFVVLRHGAELDDAAIREHLRRTLSPRHVPDRIVQVAAIPRTRTGKKVEVPVKRILNGMPLERAVAAGTLEDVSALQPFLDLVESL